MDSLALASPPARVLIVDADTADARRVARVLAAAGHRADVAGSLDAALDRLRRREVDLLVLELDLAGGDGLELLRRLDPWERPEVFVRGAALDVRRTVEAMRLGATDCRFKHDEGGLDALVLRATNAARRGLLRAPRAGQGDGAEPVITRNPRLREILDVLAVVALSQVSVLLTGESGTGKDLLARTLHRLSARARRPFVDVNCAALNESLLETELFGHEKGAFTGAVSARPGLVEAADGGTLFLDEVAELPPALQAKLLRMTEDRCFYRVGGRQKLHVDVRIVAATNRDVRREIAAGHLREDLYYRLAGVEIHVPPLRERREDVAPLARHYLDHACRRDGRPPLTLAPEALRALEQHHWPGNVRELRNVMERTALLVRSSLVEPRDLPLESGARGPLAASRPLPAPEPQEPALAAAAPGSLEQIEREEIRRVLEEEGWHRARAARRLGLPVRTLYRRIKAHKLEPRRPAAPRFASAAAEARP
jgi:DNA-binding NtrC family response regulator